MKTEFGSEWCPLTPAGVSGEELGGGMFSPSEDDRERRVSGETEATVTELSPNAAAELDTLAVELTVELGTIVVSLREMLELGLESHLPLRLPAGRQVVLRFQGEFVASAVVVRDDENLFLEIISVDEEKRLSNCGDEQLGEGEPGAGAAAEA